MVKRRSANIIAANDAASDAGAFRAAVRDVKPLTQTAPPAGLSKRRPRAGLRKAAAPALEDLDEAMPLLPTAPGDEGAVHTGAVHTGAVHTGAVHTGAVHTGAMHTGAMHMGAAQDVTGDGELSFQRAGLRPQVMRRLRRGLYPVEDELDLHGLTQTAARERLADFLARSRDRGCRCVRIIHGKGYRSGVRGPVLKTAVNLWLRRHTDVMAFVSARAIDGGTGAMYVLLRA